MIDEDDMLLHSPFSLLTDLNYLNMTILEVEAPPACL